MTREHRSAHERREVFKISLARRLRGSMTEAEKRLWSRLRRGQMGVRFRRQQPIGPYVADFYCASAKLIVEVDGGQHNELRKAHDARRDAWLRGEGYSVVRFWNTDVLANTEGVLTELMLALAAAGVGPGDNPSPCPLPQGEGGNSGRGP